VECANRCRMLNCWSMKHGGLVQNCWSVLPSGDLQSCFMICLFFRGTTMIPCTGLCVCFLWTDRSQTPCLLVFIPLPCLQILHSILGTSYLYVLFCWKPLTIWIHQDFPQTDNVRKGYVRGYAVLAVVSFVALRDSMVLWAILVFVVLSSVDWPSLDLAFE
jgi:hypothetical protein